MKINLGSGPKRMEGFTNVDIRADVNPDICCDIRHGIPVDDESVEYIHAFAVIEHFSIRELRERVLPELYRIMKPGAQIKLLVPDLKELCRRYMHFLETGETPYKREGLGTSFLYDAEDLSYWITSWGAHKIAFDTAYLKRTFEEAGFKTISINLCDHNLIGAFEK